jgi:hypothetical protein
MRKKSQKWIQKAKKSGSIKEGGLHESLGVAEDKKIPASKLKKAEHSKDPKVKKQAILAENFTKMRKKK